jgi:large subunit ribosomal protein L28
MSKICNLCGKAPVAGNNVSHSKRRTKRRFLPNLVSKKFGGIKVQICTRCLRTLKKPERVRRSAVSSSQLVDEVENVEMGENVEDKTSSAEE